MKKLLALISAVLLISACVPATTTPAPAAETTPSAPTSVTATAISKSVITVAWTASSGATSYKIYNNAGVLQTTNPVSVTGTTANIEGLNPHAAYTYKVTAVNGAGESDFSSTATDTTYVSYSTNILGMCTACHAPEFHYDQTAQTAHGNDATFLDCVTSTDGDCSGIGDMAWTSNSSYRVLIRDWKAEGFDHTN